MKLPRNHRMGGLGNLIRKVGPYGAIELLVPGGSLIALSLWAVRHRSWFVAHMRRAFALVATLAAALLAPHPSFADSAQISGPQPSEQGDYQRAGKCYLLAEDPNPADRAFLTATGPTGADSLRGLTQSRDEARAQFYPPLTTDGV